MRKQMMIRKPSDLIDHFDDIDRKKKEENASIEDCVDMVDLELKAYIRKCKKKWI